MQNTAVGENSVVDIYCDFPGCMAWSIVYVPPDPIVDEAWLLPPRWGRFAIYTGRGLAPVVVDLCHEHAVAGIPAWLLETEEEDSSTQKAQPDENVIDIQPQIPANLPADLPANVIPLRFRHTETTLPLQIEVDYGNFSDIDYFAEA